MRLDIRYRCTFEYPDLVRESQNELRACPVADERQSVLSYRVTTLPTARVWSFTDYWGTRVDSFGVRDPHILLEVVAEAAVETRPAPLLTASPPMAAVADAAFRDAHVEYLGRTAHADWGSGVAAEAGSCLELVGPDVVSVVLAIHRRVGTTMAYRPGSTYVGVDVDDVLSRREGVCQDFAHLAVSMCRSLGIPARYVSGYFFAAPTEDADVADVTTHAWFEAAVPGVGWLALDPTNLQEVGPRHVKIGHGRDYDDVPPLRGIFAGPSGAHLDVAVSIRRLPAAPTPPLWTSQAQQQQQ
jgi:transglutaminase-like putative cysteine protease